MSTRGGNYNLWRMDLDGENQIQLTSGGEEWTPRCHPDGKSVFFIGAEASRSVVFQVPVEGGEAVAVNPKGTAALAAV